MTRLTEYKKKREYKCSNNFARIYHKLMLNWNVPQILEHLFLHSMVEHVHALPHHNHAWLPFGIHVSMPFGDHAIGHVKGWQKLNVMLSYINNKGYMLSSKKSWVHHYPFDNKPKCTNSTLFFGISMMKFGHKFYVGQTSQHGLNWPKKPGAESNGDRSTRPESTEEVESREPNKKEFDLGVRSWMKSESLLGAI